MSQVLTYFKQKNITFRSCARHVLGHDNLKKSIILGLTIVMTLAASVAAFANVSPSDATHNHHDGTRVELSSHGKGACRHSGCTCSWYNRAKGGAGKCVCGHWDYVHN